MRFQIKIIESNKDIEQKILKAILPEINKSLINYSNKIIPQIRDAISTAIRSSPEYSSIVSGILGFELGIPDGDRRVSELLNIWSSNPNITIKSPSISGSKISGKITLELIRADLSDVLGSEAAIITDTKSGSMVDWLNWLSLAGDKTIIKEYNFILGSNPRSRTGGGIMRYSRTGKWKVPSEFSGTISDNWITRAIDRSANEIDNILAQTFKEIL